MDEVNFATSLISNKICRSTWIHEINANREHLDEYRCLKY